MLISVGEFTGVPEGTYPATFLGVDEKETRYGQKLYWKFQVSSGDHKGQQVGRFTGCAATSGTHCFQIAQALNGGSLEGVKTFNPESCKGKPYTIRVVKTKQGGTEVDPSGIEADGK